MNKINAKYSCFLWVRVRSLLRRKQPNFNCGQSVGQVGPFGRADFSCAPTKAHHSRCQFFFYFFLFWKVRVQVCTSIRALYNVLKVRWSIGRLVCRTSERVSCQKESCLVLTRLAFSEGQIRYWVGTLKASDLLFYFEKASGFST